jgi:hypothetical protein
MKKMIERANNDSTTRNIFRLYQEKDRDMISTRGRVFGFVGINVPKTQYTERGEEWR